MLKIGITGGIGSGKTTVCSIFEELKVPVYYADQRAKELMVENQQLARSISNLFGNEAYQNGQLNRTHISSQAFSQPKLLKQLNALVHPAVFEDFDLWCSDREKRGHAYIVKEAALLFESGSYKELDAVLVVHADKETRIDRTMKRDGSSREQVLERLNKQWSEDERLSKAYGVIDNTGKDALIPQVMHWHNTFSQGSLS